VRTALDDDELALGKRLVRPAAGALEGDGAVGVAVDDERGTVIFVRSARKSVVPKASMQPSSALSSVLRR
jgi:hypothetical protein